MDGGYRERLPSARLRALPIRADYSEKTEAEGAGRLESAARYALTTRSKATQGPTAPAYCFAITRTVWLM